MIRITVFNEFLHEKQDGEARRNYPDGIHNQIKRFLMTEEDFTVHTVTLDDFECGLTEEVLDTHG